MANKYCMNCGAPNESSKASCGKCNRSFAIAAIPAPTKITPLKKEELPSRAKIDRTASQEEVSLFSLEEILANLDPISEDEVNTDFSSDSFKLGEQLEKNLNAAKRVKNRK